MSTFPNATTLAAADLTPATVFPCSKGSAKNETTLSALADVITGRVVIASAAGAALDTSLTSGGGTDDTATLQGILNAASAANPLILVVDGPARLTASLRLKSHTTLVFPAGCGLFMTANSYAAAVTNYNRSASTRTDTDIAIIGGYFHCNGDNQGTGTSEVESGDGTILCGLAFFGVSRLKLSGCYVYQSCNWGLCVSNSDHVLVEDYRFDRGATTLQRDGLNFRGPCEFVAVHGATIKAYDDAIALNARDYSGIPAIAALLGPYILGGPITDVLIDDVTLDDCLFGVDLISDQHLIDRVTVRNIHGTCRNYALRLTYDPLNAGNVGTGNFGTITLDGCDVRATGSPYGGGIPTGTIALESVALCVVLRDLKQYEPADSRALVNVAGGGLGVLSIDGIVARDTAGNGGDLVAVSGAVQSLSVSGVDWWRGDAATQAGNVVNLLVGTVNVARFCGGVQRRGHSILRRAASTTLDLAGIANCHQVSCAAAGAALLNIQATALILRLSNWSGVAAVAGAGAASVTDKVGDAF